MRHVRRRAVAVASVVSAVALLGAGVAASTPSGGVDQLLAGVYGKLPASAPAPTKKTVWVVSCGQAAIGCSLEAGGAMAGGKAIGWNMKLCDGKFDTNDAWGTCFRQAVAAHADGI